MLTGTLTPVPNSDDWIECFKLIDTDTGEPFDITAATEIIVEILEPRCSGARLTAKLSDDTVEHVETGVFQWTFTDTQMNGLCPGTYNVRARITMDDIVTSVLIGSLPVIDG